MGRSANEINYNPWPLGQLPEELRRPEPEIIRKMGYGWDDARDIVGIFERKVAAFAGSKYAVAVDCCTHALHLSLEYLARDIWWDRRLFIPMNTYASVPRAVEMAGFIPVLYKNSWEGVYQIMPTQIYDAALRWTEGMYIKDSLMCLSFQIKKRVPIGRGGMILCDKKEEYDWLKLASYDGRDLETPYDSEDHIKISGWHYYMTPEDAARGIILMDSIPRVNPDGGGWKNYPDLREISQPYRKKWLQPK